MSIADISDILNVLLTSANGLVANSMTLGLWFLVDIVFQRATTMANGIIPNEIMTVLNGYGPLFLKMFIFHHIAIK